MKSLVESLAELLERDERDAVLGDMAEAGETNRQVLWNVCGLLARRQRAYWNDWRPWIAAFGIALPFSFPLMGLSVSLSLMSLRLIDPAMGPLSQTGVSLLLSKLLLLIAWSWTGGFVIGSVSRRTVWASALVALFPCCFCLARFRIDDLYGCSLLLFLPPAVFGVRQGLRISRLTFRSAMLIAAATTLLTVLLAMAAGPSMQSLALSWPAWYLVATAGSKQWRGGERHGV